MSGTERWHRLFEFLSTAGASRVVGPSRRREPTDMGEYECGSPGRCHTCVEEVRNLRAAQSELRARAEKAEAAAEKWKGYWRAEHTGRRDHLRTGWEAEFRRAEAEAARLRDGIQVLAERPDDSTDIYESGAADGWNSCLAALRELLAAS